MRQSMINRRTILAGVAATLASRPLSAQTAPDGVRRLGVLMANPADDLLARTYVDALMKGLRLHGWSDGGNLRVDWRWANGNAALFERYAAELVASAPDALLAQATPSVVALKQKTAKIPIVFTMVTDPIDQSFVESLARPGGNVTGFSDFNS